MFAGHVVQCLPTARILEPSATVLQLPRKEGSAGPGPSQNLTFNFLAKVFFLLFQVMALKKREREEGNPRAPGPRRCFSGLGIIFTPAQVKLEEDPGESTAHY